MRNVQAAAARRPEHPRRGNRGRPSRAWPCGHGPASGAGFDREAKSGRPSLPGPRRPLGREDPRSRPRLPPLSLGASPLPPEMPGILETDPGWAGKSGDRRRAFGGEDGAAPDLEETPVSAGNASPFAQLFLFQGLSSSSSSSIFSPSVQLFVFSDRVNDLRQEISSLYSRGTVVLMVSIPEPALS